MTNLHKKNFAFLLAAVLCMSLTACGSGGSDNVAGNDWRVTGVVQGSGTITRDGEDTDVLVCVHSSDAAFYYDTKEQVLFDSVTYPLDLESDAWEAFKSIDFADLNGDGNSDVTMNFDDGGTERLMVWFWDAENEMFMFEPDESALGEEEGRGDLIPDDEDEGQGDLIPEDDGRGDLIPDEGNAAPVLMSGALPFTNMENVQSENYDDGTYYYADATEDGQILVISTAQPSHGDFDVQSPEEYLADCALSLSGTDTVDSLAVEANDAYTAMMSYPVYIVTYTAGENEDAREWTVFAMDTDFYTYLYGFCAVPDAADDMQSVYQDIFAGLYLSDGESVG